MIRRPRPIERRLQRAVEKQPMTLTGTPAPLRGRLIAGPRDVDGTRYNGHTLAEQIEQATIRMRDTRAAPSMS